MLPLMSPFSDATACMNCTFRSPGNAPLRINATRQRRTACRR